MVRRLLQSSWKGFFLYMRTISVAIDMGQRRPEVLYAL
jgi:hypothetical protein